MKTLLAFTLFAATACHHNTPDSSATSSTTPMTSTTATASTTEPEVDPTLPSWAPKSCVAYHAAVVHAVDCQALPQAKRDEIKMKYEAANTSWHGMQNAQQTDIDSVGSTCTAENQSVRAEYSGKCTISTTGAEHASR
jgi:hypothetical protein